MRNYKKKKYKCLIILIIIQIKKYNKKETLIVIV